MMPGKIIAVSALLLLSMGVLCGREIAVTVDYCDNVWKVLKAEGSAPDKGIHTTAEIDAMMKKFASELKATRVFWIWNFYDDKFHWVKDAGNGELLSGRKLMKFLVDCAHANQLELFFIIKPFESMPQRIPHPYAWGPEDPERVNVNGVAIYSVDDFALAHPEYQFRRRPDPAPERQQLPVTAIKLVADREVASEFVPADFRIYVSRVNGDFVPLPGGFTMTAGSEERGGKKVSVLTFAVDIPAEYRYLYVQYVGSGAKKQFGNQDDQIMELYSNGVELESTIANLRQPRANIVSMMEHAYMLADGRNTGMPAAMQPENYGVDGNFSFLFDNSPWHSRRIIDHPDHPINGMAAVCRDRVERLASLHPAYPEVREYWLRKTAELIDAGADGIDLRTGNHTTFSQQGDQFGFNAPVVAEYRKRYGVDIETGDYDPARLREVQGDFLTTFIRELKALCEERGVELYGHITFMMLNESGRLQNDEPANFEYQWKRWIDEKLFDGITIKYFPWPWDKQRLAAYDPIAREQAAMLARLARKQGMKSCLDVRTDCWYMITSPVVRKGISMKEADIERISSLIKWAWQQPVDMITLYEGNDFTLLNPESGAIEIAPELVQMIDALKPAPARDGQL